jgi:hypothetical protein
VPNINKSVREPANCAGVLTAAIRRNFAPVAVFAGSLLVWIKRVASNSQSAPESAFRIVLSEPSRGCPWKGQASNSNPEGVASSKKRSLLNDSSSVGSSGRKQRHLATKPSTERERQVTGPGRRRPICGLNTLHGIALV